MAEQNPLDNVDPLIVLRLFEADVTHRRYDQAEECLLWLLQNASIFPSQPNKLIPPTYNEREVVYVATRLAAGLCQMFADPAFGIKDENYYKWAILHENMVAILGVSGFGNADHVIQNLLEPVEGSKVENVSREAFNKVLLLHDSDSEVKIPYENYLKSHPKHILWMMILAVGKLFCVTEKENDARNRLIEMLIDKVDIKAFDQTMLGWTSIAWMHCSYATTPLRNKVKKTFNKMLVSWMESVGVKQNQLVKPADRNGKPVLLVINEYFKTSHAMYRCYAPTIDALREHFYLVGMTGKKHCDDESIKHFDEHHYIEWNDDVIKSIKSMVDGVKNIKPHAIYYPSIGMNISSIMMANLRLAKCQFMSLGHPASSHSDVIDYCLVEDQYVVDRSQFSESIWRAVDGFTRFVPHADMPERNKLLKWNNGIDGGEKLKIIITASAMKNNSEFISALREIQNRVCKDVEFHFMPNLNKISGLLFGKKVKQVIRSYVVHDQMSYVDYLKVVSRCQVHISPFPFSSTNSLVDSLILGIPIVVMDVKDNEVGADAAIVRRLGVEGLEPQAGIENYIKYSCRIIDDDDFRRVVSEKIRESDVKSIFFSDHGSASTEGAIFIRNQVLQNIY